MEQKNALGRRKSAVARVYLAAGQGNVTINGRSVEEYFKTDALRYIVNQPFAVTKTEGQFDVKVNVVGGGTKDTKPVEWMAETGVIGVDSPDKKYLSRLTVRMWLDIGTQVYFFVQYDSGGEWEHLFTMTGNSLRSFAVPIRPKRCDHLRIRIVGEGDAKIYSIAKVIEEGSDY